MVPAASFRGCKNVIKSFFKNKLPFLVSRAGFSTSPFENAKRWMDKNVATVRHERTVNLGAGSAGILGGICGTGVVYVLKEGINRLQSVVDDILIIKKFELMKDGFDFERAKEMVEKLEKKQQEEEEHEGKKAEKREDKEPEKEEDPKN